MKTIQIGNLTVGEGRPKIIIPILHPTKEGLLQEAANVRTLCADLVEWRLDWFEHAMDESERNEMLALLKQALGDLPLLVTFRTAAEGGQLPLEGEDYAALIRSVAESGKADLIDVELFTAGEEGQALVEACHAKGVAVVMSSHDFHKTPDKAELVSRLAKMQALGADLPKLAVMPRSAADVLTLLSATEEFHRTAQQPIITMSMGKLGVVSRLSGEAFGSAMTFGAAAKASAPGQIAAGELANILNLLKLD